MPGEKIMVGKLNKILIPLLMLLIPLSVFVSSAAAVDCDPEEDENCNPASTPTPTSTPTPPPTPTPAPTPTTVVSVPAVKNATNTNTTIQIKVDNVNKLAAAKIDIIYTQSIVNVVSVSAGDFDNVTTKIDTGKTSIIAFNVNAAAKSGSVVFAKIVLKAIGQKNDISPLNLSVQSLSDENGNNIPFTVRNGTFKITALRKGDINSDTTVNIADALLIARHDVGLNGLDPDQLEAADINGDGKVNVVDAYLIAKYTVGKYTL